MGRPRIFEHETLREPALRPDDGRPYAESLEVRADEVRAGDVVETIGTVMAVASVGKYVRVSGRALAREWLPSRKVKIVRRNWDKQ